MKRLLITLLFILSYSTLRAASGGTVTMYNPYTNKFDYIRSTDSYDNRYMQTSSIVANYVPYIGATSLLNLGNYSLYSNGLNVTGLAVGTGQFISTSSGSVTRDGDNLVSSLAFSHGRTISLTRTGGLINSYTDGIRTWTINRNADNRIVNWTVWPLFAPTDPIYSTYTYTSISLLEELGASTDTLRVDLTKLQTDVLQSTGTDIPATYAPLSSPSISGHVKATGQFISTSSGSVTRDGDGRISTIAFSQGRTVTFTIVDELVTSYTDGVNTWTLTYNSDGQIANWTVAP